MGEPDLHSNIVATCQLCVCVSRCPVQSERALETMPSPVSVRRLCPRNCSLQKRFLTCGLQGCTQTSEVQQRQPLPEGWRFCSSDDEEFIWYFLPCFAETLNLWDFPPHHGTVIPAGASTRRLLEQLLSLGLCQIIGLFPWCGTNSCARWLTRSSQGSNKIKNMYKKTSCFNCKDALKHKNLGPAVSQRQTGLAFRLAVAQ